MIHVANRWTVAAALTLLLCSGCRRMSTDYGSTKGVNGRQSLNGFGAFRESYERTGFRTRDVSRLSDRVMRTDVIVWTPKILGTVDTRVTRWFEKWLGRGGRTLVYVVPDSGSEADYWLDAAKLAPANQRLEYRKRAARSINERMMWRLNRGQVPSNGWFRIRTLENRKRVSKIGGAWAKDMADRSDPQTEIAVEFVVVPYAEPTNGPAATSGQSTSGPTGPGTPRRTYLSETQPTKTPINCTAVVSTEKGDSIVLELRSKRWRDSRIIVVAGGSLLTNYAFTRNWNRRLAAQIVQKSTPASKSDPRAGFLTSNWNAIPVSEKKPGVPQASGMELLTVWPMSLVTMHGVMLGLVVCLMLLPIFGRPRKIRRSKQSDFGHHLDAVAALMNKSGGQQYARARISEYMKRMHGETSGPWVLPDPPTQGTRNPVPNLTAKRFAARDPSPHPGAIDPAASSQSSSADLDLVADRSVGDIVSDPPSPSGEKQESDNDEAER
jgi:hypothetical protein